MKFKYSQPYSFKQKQSVQMQPEAQKPNITAPKPNKTQVREKLFHKSLPHKQISYSLFPLLDGISICHRSHMGVKYKPGT